MVILEGSVYWAPALTTIDDSSILSREGAINLPVPERIKLLSLNEAVAGASIVPKLLIIRVLELKELSLGKLMVWLLPAFKEIRVAVSSSGKEADVSKVNRTPSPEPVTVARDSSRTVPLLVRISNWP